MLINLSKRFVGECDVVYEPGLYNVAYWQVSQDCLLIFSRKLNMLHNRVLIYTNFLFSKRFPFL